MILECESTTTQAHRVGELELKVEPTQYVVLERDSNTTQAHPGGFSRSWSLGLGRIEKHLLKNASPSRLFSTDTRVRFGSKWWADRQNLLFDFVCWTVCCFFCTCTQIMRCRSRSCYGSRNPQINRAHNYVGISFRLCPAVLR